MNESIDTLCEEFFDAIENYSESAERAETIQGLLKQYPVLANHASPMGEYPLHAAASENCTYAISLLIDAGALVNQLSRDRHACSPLHIAIQQGHVAACELLIRHGADLDLRKANGLTPLMTALYAGRHEVACALMRLGSQIDLRSAVWLRQTQIIRLMLSNDNISVSASPDAEDLVSEATAKSNLTSLRILLAAGANPNVNNLMPPSLYLAARSGDVEAVKLLLEYNADPDRSTKEGGTIRNKIERDGYTWALDYFT